MILFDRQVRDTNRLLALQNVMDNLPLEAKHVNPNKAGLFENSFWAGGGGFELSLHISRRTNLISI